MRVYGFGDNGSNGDAAIVDPEAPPTMVDSSGNQVLDQYGTPIPVWRPGDPGSSPEFDPTQTWTTGVVSPPVAQPSAVVPKGSTTPTGSKAGANTPGVTFASTFSDIFGNLAKNVLPAAINKYTGIVVPGNVPGNAAKPPLTNQGVTIGAKAGIGAGALIALAVGAYFLLGKKR